MIQVKIDNHKLMKLQKENAERYNFLRELDDNLPAIKLKENGDPEYIYRDFQALVNEPDQIPDWIVAICDISIPKRLRFGVNQRLDTQLAKELLARQQVHLPGNELLKIRECEVIEDACTDHLNEKLKEGWRILSVLPQTGNRRPDYVLGLPEDPEQEKIEKRILHNRDVSAEIPF